jgi:CheY-like chemotaxis protein
MTHLFITRFNNLCDNQASEGTWERPAEGKLDREFPRNLGIAVDGHKRKVLVVYSERVVTDTLAIIVNQYGFDASVAYDGASAIECAQRISPEFVVMGVIMPGMNGVEAAISIREWLPSCKILLFSGSRFTGLLLEKARAQGYEFEWISMPVHPNDLLHWVSVEGTHDVRSCSWCKERFTSQSGFHGGSCNCTWCVGLGAPSSPAP